MRLRILIEIAAALLLTFAALLAISQMARAADLKIEGAYARASIGMARTGAVYLTVTNDGSAPDRLRGVATELAEHSELHLHALKGEVMTMTPVKCLTIGPGRSITMAPGGLHVMLTGLASPLKQGQEFPLHLRFDSAGEIAVTVAVDAADAGHHGMAGGAELEFCD